MEVDAAGGGLGKTKGAAKGRKNLKKKKRHTLPCWGPRVDFQTGGIVAKNLRGENRTFTKPGKSGNNRANSSEVGRRFHCNSLQKSPKRLGGGKGGGVVLFLAKGKRKKKLTVYRTKPHKARSWGKSEGKINKKEA